MRLRGQPCRVVGGGEVAARRIAALVGAGARVTVVAPEVCPAVRALLDNGTVSHIASRFEPEFLRGAHLVVAATDDPDVNRQVAEAATAMRIPVNVVDAPRLCTFVMPAIIDRSPLVIAVSSGGASPVLARLLRARLETLIPPGFGRLAALAAEFRERVRGRFAAPAARRGFWERVLRGPIADLALAGQEARARRALAAALDDASGDTVGRGIVHLVGAGPGNPELLTLRALSLLQQADVIVYDHLVGEGVLDLARRDAERVYVGKRRSRHSLPQEEINKLLVNLASAGKRVVRLKGGDPFFFGRGGEELEALAACAIPFEVVPGVTAASGVAAYAGIPLTHRDYAQSCIFATGHLKDGTVNLDWAALARPRQTVVIYMGLGAMAEILRQLVRHGLPPETPAAAVQSGTTEAQRVVTGTLATLPDLVSAIGLASPVLLIVGEVVKLHRRLDWFAPTPVAEPVPSEVVAAAAPALDPRTAAQMQRYTL